MLYVGYLKVNQNENKRKTNVIELEMFSSIIKSLIELYLF